MFEKLNEKFKNTRQAFSEMPSSRKVLVLTALAAVLTFVVVMLIWTGKTEYGVLYTGLSPEDSGAILTKLRERKIPYRITDGGTVIEVPASTVHETRAVLATDGLPLGGSIGMEVFNQPKLGETDFLQHLNYQRALQGELERTIKTFPEVEKVRVHINIPKQSLFIEEDRPPTASVILSLTRGKSLSRSQLQGIVHMVASSVEGLIAENITVVDTSGGLLYSKEEEAEGGLTPSQVQYRRDLEKSLGMRVTSMLERVVGPDKVMSRVTAELTFQQIKATEEIYDPDRTSIRSEQRLKESNVGPPRGASGIPQSSFELGTGNQQTSQGAGAGEVYERSEETTNYEITKINRQITTSPGDVKRISVAVMVDGTYNTVEQDGVKQKVYQARSQAQLDQLTELVKRAVGYDEQRGDSVVVENIPFWLPEEPPETWESSMLELLERYGRTLANIVLVFLFFLFVVRPIMTWFRRASEPEIQPMEPPALPAGEGADALPDFKKEPHRLSRDHVLQVAQQDPEGTINLLRSWIDEQS
jgi:flagellar M-ring protein FliF